MSPQLSPLFSIIVVYVFSIGRHKKTIWKYHKPYTTGNMRNKYLSKVPNILSLRFCHN